ncbi:MAG: phosphopantetheine-binding protein [Bacteriovoracaceae bacterium]|jgi:acyl carrier protein|nr:acyl carrier protein [Halobacteriovoraceae bacterium]MDP7319452.1 phosphopantetheine-binding protein [Bacteriovoracaceae bacterium]
MATQQEIIGLISEITGVSQEEIKMTDEFKSDLKMDSIAIVDLISSLEEDFDVIIEMEKAMTIKNVQQLIDEINSN